MCVCSCAEVDSVCVEVDSVRVEVDLARRKWNRPFKWHVNESFHTYECVMSELSHTYECSMSHMRMRHVTHRIGSTHVASKTCVYEKKPTKETYFYL